MSATEMDASPETPAVSADPYEAPEVDRIGTVEELTEGAQFLNTPGDFTSQID